MSSTDVRAVSFASRTCIGSLWLVLSLIAVPELSGRCLRQEALQRLWARRGVGRSCKRCTPREMLLMALRNLAAAFARGLEPGVNFEEDSLGRIVT